MLRFMEYFLDKIIPQLNGRREASYGRGGNSLLNGGWISAAGSL